MIIDRTTVPLSIDQGASFELPVENVTDSCSDDIQPVPLNNCTAKMKIRSSWTAVDVLLELTTENGRITINEPQGIVTLFISAEDTALLPAPWHGVFDLDVVSPTGVVSRILKGTVDVVAGVNHDSD